jgi:3,4-dihydroxy 2-butanone 4-phosphate synthase/GTP cyclohydrolase II
VTAQAAETGLAGAIKLDDVTRAIDDIAAGRPVVVVDDADRENEGDLVFAAAKATPELLAFTIRYARGLICVPMLGADLDRLSVPQMTSQNQEHHGTAFTISVDARHGISTGISAADRARTILLLASPSTGHNDLVRPGHVFPLRYAEGGVLRRRGHTEAAVDLTRLAGLPSAGVVCEIVNDDGTMMRLPKLREFADEHGLALISIEQLIDYRRRTERLVTRVAQTQLPNAYGRWLAYGYRSDIDDSEHLALVLGDIGDGEEVLTRIHSECLTGDVFGSQRCDCGAQLDAAMAKIAEHGRGVVLYLRGHEGRGIGLLSKLQAYELQDAGADTVDANLELGLPVDAREYSVAGQLLTDLEVRSVRLLTNNPAKVAALARHGFGVTRIPLPPLTTPHNLRYLTAKRDRLGHQIDSLREPKGAPVSGLRSEGAQRLSDEGRHRVQRPEASGEAV